MESTTTENPGEYVIRRCREMEVPVVRVAEKAKVDLSAIYRWKRGKNTPYWDSWSRVERVFEDLGRNRGETA